MSDHTHTHDVLLFAYGTLKQGYGNNRLLKAAKFLGPAISVENNYRMQDHGFPILWQATNETEPFTGQVMGEVYRINKEQLARCDQLESNGRMYTRSERSFKLLKRGGGVVTAWVYLWNLGHYDDDIVPNDYGVLIWDSSGRRKLYG